MATNLFLPFAAGAGANVITDAAYASDMGTSGSLATGFVAGLAVSAQVNKVLRQSSLMSAMLGQIMVDYANVGPADSATVASLEAALIKGLLAAIVTPEVTRATTAESALGTRVTGETTRATNAEAALGTRVTNETSRAVGVEGTINSFLTAVNNALVATEAKLTNLDAAYFNLAYYTLGNTNVVVPAWANFFDVMAVGGGGGGSDCQATSTSSQCSGGGGGAGGFIYGTYAVTPGETLVMNIGAGGAAQATGNTTLMSRLGNIMFQCIGGGGSSFSATATSPGGAGGAAAGGTIINRTGGAGSDGQSGPNFIFAGNGAIGPWGGGGRAGAQNVIQATGFGCGGSGVYDSALSGTLFTGGYGAQGCAYGRFRP